MSAASDVLSRVSVAGILSNLGCDVPLRGTRTKCPIHRGENQTFSFDERKGVWHCFSCGQGGGKVKLVQLALGYQPQPALAWIADLAGIPLSTWTPAVARDRSAKWRAAEARAQWLVDWKEDTIDHLRRVRECYQLVYHWAIRRGDLENERALWATIRAYDQKIQWHVDAPWEQLADIYRDVIERSVAA